MRPGVATLSALAMLAGCSKEPILGLPNQPGGNPLVPDYAMYPFPSDFYAPADANTATGRSIQIPQEALPAGLLPQTFDGIDGWSRVPMILAHFASGIDPDSLPDFDDEDATLAANSPVFLVREDTWDKVPLLVELDATAELDGERSLILRPRTALDFDAGYVVILRDSLLTPEGDPLPTLRAFRALRDGHPTDSDEVEAQRGDFELVSDAIKQLDLDRDEVVLAWSFHTRSEAQVIDPLFSMADQMMTAELGDMVIEQDTTDAQDGRVVFGHFEAPSFIGPEGRFVLDAAGAAQQYGTADVPFMLKIPNEVQGPRPVILFGHGFFSYYTEPNRGTFESLLEEGAFSSVSTNFLGFNADDTNTTITLLADFNRTIELSTQQMQSEANHVAMQRLIDEQLAGAYAQLDAERSVYLGTSNGGTQGWNILATAPNIDRGVLVVPGGALSHMLQRASQWQQVWPLLEARFDDARDLQLGMALIQLNLDYWDSANFVQRMLSNRVGDRGPVRVTLHEAVEDAQVNNMVTHWLARSADIPVFPSTIQPWGLAELPPQTFEGEAALYIYDMGHDELPRDNTAPTENGAHGQVRSQASYKAHVIDFVENDAITFVCDGACDPS